MGRIDITLSEQDHSAWKAFCRKTNNTSSKIIRDFIQNTLNHHPLAALDKVTKTPKSNKITIRFSQSEYDKIIQRVSLEGYNTPTHWVRSLVFYALHHEAVLTDKEIQALDNLSYQLWTIGRNLNQITKALNHDVNQHHKLKTNLLTELKTLVTHAQQQSSELIAQNKNRFSRNKITQKSS